LSITLAMEAETRSEAGSGSTPFSQCLWLRSLRFVVDWQGNLIGRRGTEPPPLRVDDELPRRAHKNKMMGNAIDPLIAYELMRCIRVMK